jgi:hypothetical protein
MSAYKRPINRSFLITLLILGVVPEITIINLNERPDDLASSFIVIPGRNEEIFRGRS